MKLSLKNTPYQRRYELGEMAFVLVGVPLLLLVIHLTPKDPTPCSGSRKAIIIAYFFLAAYFSVYVLWIRYAVWNRWLSDITYRLHQNMQMDIVRGGHRLNTWLSGWSMVLLIAICSGAMYVYYLWAVPALQNNGYAAATPQLVVYLGKAHFWGYATLFSFCGLVLYPFFFRQWWSALEDLKGVMLNLRAAQIGRTSTMTLSSLLKGVMSSNSTEGLRIDSRQEKPAFSVAGLQWNWSDICRNTIIFGETGSGKTSCVMNALLEGTIGAHGAHNYPVSGLLLDPKGEYLGALLALCEKYSMATPLVLDFSRPEQSLRWNLLRETDRPVEEIVADIILVCEMLSGSQNNQGDFWKGQAQEWFSNAIHMLRAIEPEQVSFKRLHTLATDVRDQQQLLNRFAEYFNHLDSGEKKESAKELAIYWQSHLELRETAPQQLAGLIGYIQNFTYPFIISAEANRLFCSESDFSLERSVSGGRILYVYVPIDRYALLSRSILALLKLQYFRRIRSVHKGKGHGSFFFCDEYQQMATFDQAVGDSDFFATCRSYHHANIVATQNVSGLLAKAPPQRPELVYQLVANCATKIFLHNSDVETNKFGQEQFPEQNMIIHNHGQNMQQGWRMNQGVNINQTSAMVPSVPQAAFLNLLTPSKEAKISFVESYVVHPNSRYAQIYRWPRHVLEKPGMHAVAIPPDVSKTTSPHRDPLRDFD